MRATPSWRRATVPPAPSKGGRGTKKASDGGVQVLREIRTRGGRTKGGGVGRRTGKRGRAWRG